MFRIKSNYSISSVCAISGALSASHGQHRDGITMRGDGKANKTSYSTFLRSLITSIVIKYNLLIFRLESKGLSELVIVNAMGLLKLI